MAAKLPPGVTTYPDRYGRARYRFRRKGLPDKTLPEQPGTDRFRAAYEEALAGASRAPKVQPRTIGAAWIEVQATVEWRTLKPISQDQQRKVADRFLCMTIAPGATETFATMPFAGMKRGHVKKILGRYSNPHAAEAALRLLRKLAGAALDLDWIENDPTHRVKFRPKLIGHRAWTDTEMATFEARWPLGSKERTAYALALYVGHRRGDLAAARWDAFDGQGIVVVQEKTGAPLWIPAHPNLQAALAVVARDAEHIISGPQRRGYTAESLGNLMADAIEDAGLPEDCVLHGLRKSTGRCLAEAGATTRQIMAVLGHKTIKEAENYTRGAEQKKLAVAGIETWARPKLIAVK